MPVNLVKVAPKNGQKLLKSCQKSKKLLPEFKKLLAKVKYFILYSTLNKITRFWLDETAERSTINLKLYSVGILVTFLSKCSFPFAL